MSNLISILNNQQKLKLSNSFIQVLADYIGVPCSLVRGTYDLAWNEVLVASDPSYPQLKYIVDVMYEPGRLLRYNSPQAIIYQTI